MTGRRKITLLPAPRTTGGITDSSAITNKTRVQQCPALRMGHTRSPDCWCKPDVRTHGGVQVVTHRHFFDADQEPNGDSQK